MKVTSITAHKRRSDQKEYWKVDFEEVDIPLITSLNLGFRKAMKYPRKN